MTSSASDVSDDAAILAQIQALKSRLSSNADLAVAVTPANKARVAQNAPRSASSILAPQSPSRRPEARGGDEGIRGPAFISAQATRGVDALRQTAAQMGAAGPSQPRPTGLLQSARHQYGGAALPFASSAIPPEQQRLRQERRKEVLSTLTPGPRKFRQGCDFRTIEAFSNQPLRKRQISHQHLNESIMDGRYFLTPSDLYTVAEYKGRGRGTDGDYDVPVEGDFVIILTVRGSKICYPKGTEDNTTTTEDRPPGANMPWLTEQEDEEPSSSPVEPKSPQNFTTKLDQRPKGNTRFIVVELQDLSERDDGDTKGSPGYKRLELIAFDDSAEKQGSGVGSSVFNKLNSSMTGGDVVAVINPKLSRHEKNGMISLKPQDTESVFVIGHSSVYACCGAIKKSGEKCGAFVDKRTLGTRGAICAWHLEKGVVKTQKGRQEFANGTTGFGGRGGGFRGGSGGPKRPAGDLTYGLEGGAVGGRQYVTAQTETYGDDDPRSRKFSLSQALGSNRTAEEQNRKKQEQEAQMLLALESQRAGLAGSRRPRRPASSQEAMLSTGNHPSSQPQSLDDLQLPTYSTGVLAIRDAKKTLEQRKEAAAAARAQKSRPGNTGKNLNKRQKTDREAIFGENSDDEAAASAQRQDLKRPESSSTQSADSGSTRWRHRASAIKLMGFDPLSDARSRGNRLDTQCLGGEGRDNLSFLLARHSARPSSLPTPNLALKKASGDRPGTKVKRTATAGFKKAPTAAPCAVPRPASGVLDLSDDGDDDYLEILS
ncbi:unnamed protein product [Parajaminaea phylloscopi]